MEIEVESLNVFRAVSGQAVGCQEGRNLIVRESKDNLEVQRSAFATDDLEAEVTDLFMLSKMYLAAFFSSWI